MMTAGIGNTGVELPKGRVSFDEALREWARIGLLNFGGPTAQIALMHRIVVEEKAWLDEQHFLSALSFCMLLTKSLPTFTILEIMDEAPVT
jgi:chromate transporter